MGKTDVTPTHLGTVQLKHLGCVTPRHLRLAMGPEIEILGEVGVSFRRSGWVGIGNV
jgi:hypothetical protein